MITKYIIIVFQSRCPFSLGYTRARLGWDFIAVTCPIGEIFLPLPCEDNFTEMVSEGKSVIRTQTAVGMMLEFTATKGTRHSLWVRALRS